MKHNFTFKSTAFLLTIMTFSQLAVGQELNKGKLISFEHKEMDTNGIWYGEYGGSLIGTIDSLDDGVYITVTNYDNEFKLKNKGINFGPSSFQFFFDDFNMSIKDIEVLTSMLIPGNKVKFSVVEGCPGCGTAYNGLWTITKISKI